MNFDNNLHICGYEMITSYLSPSCDYFIVELNQLISVEFDRSTNYAIISVTGTSAV